MFDLLKLDYKINLEIIICVQDRPICRTVADADYVLDGIIGFDRNDVSTRKSLKYIQEEAIDDFSKLMG